MFCNIKNHKISNSNFKVISLNSRTATSDWVDYCEMLLTLASCIIINKLIHIGTLVTYYTNWNEKEINSTETSFWTNARYPFFGQTPDLGAWDKLNCNIFQRVIKGILLQNKSRDLTQKSPYFDTILWPKHYYKQKLRSLDIIEQHIRWIIFK